MIVRHSEAQRIETCARIETNVKNDKRQRNDLERQIRQAQRRRPELRRQRRAFEERLQELDRMAMEGRLRSRLPRRQGRAGTEAPDALSAGAIENEKAKIQNQIAALDREISDFDSTLSELRRRLDEKRRLISQSQNAFSDIYECGELGFSHETLDLN